MTTLSPAKSICWAERLGALVAGRGNAQRLLANFARGQRRLAKRAYSKQPPPGEPLGFARTEVGRFRIDCLIQKTDISCVYRATDLDSGRPVVVKEPIEDIYQYLIAREWRILRRLDYPNIVRALAYQNGCLVEDFLPGAQLHPLRLSPIETLVVGLQILDALDFAHQRNIVLRDLKTNNTIVTPDGEVKLFDFGFAKDPGEKNDLGCFGEFYGTPETSAPELIRCGSTVARPASDYYSLGILLYHVLTGHYPMLRVITIGGRSVQVTFPDRGPMLDEGNLTNVPKSFHGLFHGLMAIEWRERLANPKQVRQLIFEALAH